MNEELTAKELKSKPFYMVNRIAALLGIVLAFFPGLNPARICEMINKNVSLFTAAISYSTLTGEMGRAFNKGWISTGNMVLLNIGAIVLILGIAAACAGACMSLGNRKMRNLGAKVSIYSVIADVVGIILILASYFMITGTERADKVVPMFPNGYVVYAVLVAALVVSSIVIAMNQEKADADDKFYMESKYKLFLMFMPFAALCFIFSYLPLYGWRYAFFDYRAGGTLSAENFAGFKWFTNLFQSQATRADVVRVLRNTLAMSGLGIITSWIPLAFAIFLNEIKNVRFRRFVQTFTTIPNFISWVLVYAIALAIFSTDGFINTFASQFMGSNITTNYLMGDNYTWFKMLAWGIWKGVGWSAIIYIAGISGIDQGLYEAATVDGAGRFQKMWHISVPGLMPTYCVMLLMSIANILSNGMDQYLVFKNAQNMNHIQVLDLYVYTLGIENGNIPLSTVIGMVKSVVSVVLLFGANKISKAVRGESIV